MKAKEIIRSKFSRDTLWLILAQGFTLLSGFFITLFIGNSFGIGELGYFHQSLAFYMVLTTLFGMGLNNTVIKKTAAAKSDNSNEVNFTGSVLVITLFTSTILTSLTILLLLTIPDILSSNELLDLLIINLLALPIFGLNKNFAAYYSGKRNQQKVALIRCFRWTSTALFIFTFSEWQFSLTETMFSILIVESLILIYNVFSNRVLWKFQFSKSEAKNAISFGLGSYISEVASIVNTSIDVIIIGYLLSHEEAGTYSFIIYFVKTLYIFPGILMQNVNPIISGHWSNNTIHELNHKLGRLRSVNTIILSVQSIGLILLFVLLIGYFKNVSDAILPFCISVLGSYFFALISWGGSILIMTGKLKANFYRTLLVLLINVLSIYLFTDIFGLMGSAVAICLNGITSFILLRTFIYHNTGIKLA